MITELRTRNNSIVLQVSGHQQNPAHVNAVSESQQETNSRMSVLSVSTKLRAGFWNIHTMYETGKQAQVLREMKQNRLHILGVSESRWTDFGKKTTSKGETIIFSGRRDGQHHEGVAIILGKTAA